MPVKKPKIYPRNKSLTRYLTISRYNPNGKSKGFRGRWKTKPLKDDRIHLDIKPIYRQTQAQVETAAISLLEESRESKDLGVAERAFTEEERNEIFTKCLQLKKKKIDIIGALVRGESEIQAEGEYAQLKLSHFWQRFLDAPRKSTWSKKNREAYESLFKWEENKFFASSLSTFVKAEIALPVVQQLFSRNHQPKAVTYNTFGKMLPRKTKGWKSRSACMAHRSRIKVFFHWLRLQPEGSCLNATTIEDFLNPEIIFPPDLTDREQDSAANLEQVACLIECFARNAHRKNKRGLKSNPQAGYIVFKLFMGARSELLQHWKWSVWDRVNDEIVIPADQTKLKKGRIRFSTSWIPNFDKWLQWAWEIDGKPSAGKPICSNTRTVKEKIKRKFFNDHKAIFALEDKMTGRRDLRAKIKPSETHKNFERNTFISYGMSLAYLDESKSMGITSIRIATIAEDRHNLDKYIDVNKQVDHDTALKFFEMTPETYQQYLPKDFGKQ